MTSVLTLLSNYANNVSCYFRCLAVAAMLRSTSTSLAGASGRGLFAATAVDLKWKHGPWGHKVRTFHGAKWWLKATGEGRLSAKEIDMKDMRPGFADFAREVDRPFVVPHDATCFNCKKGVKQDADPNTYVWAPSGNAAVPTKAGYFFHTNCFRCHKCHLRLFGNKFYSQDDRAYCVPCALGKTPEMPMRWWHQPRVGPGRYNSRMTGHEFPRHKKQIEFIYDPTT
jgi:hypothetical protein